MSTEETRQSNSVPGRPAALLYTVSSTGRYIGVQCWTRGGFFLEMVATGVHSLGNSMLLNGTGRHCKFICILLCFFLGQD